MKNIFLTGIFSISAFVSNAQTSIEVKYHDTKQDGGIVYLYDKSNSFAFGYQIPSCAWKEIADSVCKLEIVLDNKRYSFGLLNVSDLADAKKLSFNLRGSIPKIIKADNYAVQLLGSRRTSPDTSSSELLIIK